MTEYPRIRPYGKTILRKILLADDVNLNYKPSKGIPIVRPKPVTLLSEIEFENWLELR
jgi:hypothetical protein